MCVCVCVIVFITTFFSVFKSIYLSIYLSSERASDQFTSIFFLRIPFYSYLAIYLAQLAGDVEYTDCFSAEG